MTPLPASWWKLRCQASTSPSQRHSEISYYRHPLRHKVLLEAGTILLRDVRKDEVIDNDLRRRTILPAPGLRGNNMTDVNRTGVTTIGIKMNDAIAIDHRSPGVANTEGTRAEATHHRAGECLKVPCDEVLILRSNS
jgi:hypothetical protein